MSGTTPPDIRYTDLTPAQVAFLQQTVPVDAKRNNLTATIDTVKQTNDLMTVTIHFSPIQPTPAPVAAPNASIPAQPQVQAVAPAVGTPAARAAGELNFAAGGLALTQGDIDQAVADLGHIAPELLWAIIRKESETLTGYLPDRRPVILYERHIFATRSRNQFTASYPDLSGRPYTTYGTLADQYTRLTQAMALDRTAALEACSWGLGQVLGENATALGYADVDAMVTEAIQSEGKQLNAVVAFLRHNNLVEPLRNKQWDEFSNIYNGGSNAAYARLLEQAHDSYVTGGLPDLNIRTGQLYLTYLDYGLSVDGRFGDHTRAAVSDFQSRAGIVPVTGMLDQSTLGAIRRAIFG